MTQTAKASDGERRLCLAVASLTVPRWASLARLPMSAPGLDPSQQSTVSGRQLALIVYILYFVSYFTGITALIGVIIAHVQPIRRSASEHALPLSNSHVLDRSLVYCNRNSPHHGCRWDRRVVLVVPLVARAQRQRRAGAE